jgi:hypothetical protein
MSQVDAMPDVNTDATPEPTPEPPPDANARADIFPPRPAGAITGSAFYERVLNLPLAEREAQMFQEIVSGNVPASVRGLHDVAVSDTKSGRRATVRVTGDYLAVGSDDDYLRTPMSPLTAQRIADQLGCLLPTKKLVDDIYALAQRQIAIPIPPPGRDMVLMPRFRQHSTLVDQNLVGALGDLLAGHKKDVVITRRLAEVPQRVAIYGFFKENRTPWQSLQLPHEDSYADYSHGIRLVVDAVALDTGDTLTLTEVLADASLAPLVSEEGVLTCPRYRIHAL